jgi:hypothetical protein
MNCASGCAGVSFRLRNAGAATGLAGRLAVFQNRCFLLPIRHRMFRRGSLQNLFCNRVFRALPRHDKTMTSV